MNSIYYQHGVESALVKVGLDGLTDRRQALLHGELEDPNELEALQQYLAKNEVEKAQKTPQGLFSAAGLAVGGGLGTRYLPDIPSAALNPLAELVRKIPVLGPIMGSPAILSPILKGLVGSQLGNYAGSAAGNAIGGWSGRRNADQLLNEYAQGNVKQAFLGFDPAELKHIGVRAAGGALGGAGIGALASEEGHRGEGALTGGLAGGLMAGGASALKKRMMRVDPNDMQLEKEMLDVLTPEQIMEMHAQHPHIPADQLGQLMRATDISEAAKGVQGMNALNTAGGGALMGWVGAGMMGGKQQKDATQ